MIGAIELFVAGADLQHRLLPVSVIAWLVRAVVGRVEVPGTIDEIVEQTAMPWLSGIDPHFETEPAIGIRHWLLLVARADLHPAHKVLVAIGGAQPLMPIRPIGGDPAAADDAIGFHLKYVGKVGTDRDLQIEPDLLAAVVGD